LLGVSGDILINFMSASNALQAWHCTCINRAEDGRKRKSTWILHH
jgi:hypothetical protein